MAGSWNEFHNNPKLKADTKIKEDLKKKSFKHTRRAETVLKWVLVCFKGLILDKSVFTLFFLNDYIKNVNENITDH